MTKTPTELFLEGGGIPNARTAEILRLADEAHEEKRSFHDEAMFRGGFDRDEYRRRHEAESARSEQARNAFLELCRPATVYDYKAWFDGWTRSGGRVDNRADRLFPGHGWEVLVAKDAFLPSLYGARALNVIVPRGHRLEVPNTFHGGSGHSRVYFMDGFRSVPDEAAPIFGDMA